MFHDITLSVSTDKMFSTADHRIRNDLNGWEDNAM